MGANSIRGMTIELSADAKGFNKSMAEMRRETSYSQKELNALQKSLELEFNPATLIKAQQAAQAAIDKTNEQAEMLNKKLAEMEKKGNVDTSQYAKLKAELAQTELQAQKLEKTLNELKSKMFKSGGGKRASVGNTITTIIPQNRRYPTPIFYETPVGVTRAVVDIVIIARSAETIKRNNQAKIVFGNK
jgi:phage-related minor tail protein